MYIISRYKNGSKHTYEHTPNNFKNKLKLWILQPKHTKKESKVILKLNRVIFTPFTNVITVINIIVSEFK